MIASAQTLAAFELRMVADRYAMAVDRGDCDLFADQFMADGVLEAPKGHFVGREALAGVPDMMKRLYKRTHHGVVGMVPVFDGETATAQTYSYARHYYDAADGAERCFEMTVRYEDLFCRGGEVWKLQKRVLVLVGEADFALQSRQV